MQLYKDFRPTPFDCYNIGGLPGNWLVPDVIQTRDSSPLEESNFATFSAALDRANIEYETHRFGHWGPGWFEILLVAPTEESRTLIEELERQLSDYPVLDEEDFSRREWEDAENTWRNCRLRERIRLIAEYGDGNIFAARRDEIPDNPTGALFERLVRS